MYKSNKYLAQIRVVKIDIYQYSHKLEFINYFLFIYL